MPISDRRWDRLAEEREFTQLDDLRTASEQWRNGIGALTGALGTASVLKGVDAFADLPSSWRYVAVGLASVGFVLLATSTGLAMRAAFRQPKLLLNTGEDFRNWVKRESIATFSALRWSKRLAIPALAALAATVMISWMAPPPGSTASTVQVVKRDGTTLCAELETANAKGITLTLGNGRVSTPWARVKSVESSCQPD